MTPLRRIATVVAAGALLLFGATASGSDLLDVYRLATQNDPQVRSAEAQRLAEVEARPQSRALLRPFVTFDAEYNRIYQRITETNFPGAEGTSRYGAWGMSLNLVQPLYHREYFAQLRQADAIVGRADAQYAAAQQGLIVRASSAYFNVLAAGDVLEFSRAEKNSIERQLEQAKQRFDVGLIAITDVHVAQAAFDLATAQEIEAANQLQTAQEALFELTGEFITDVDSLTREIPLAAPEPAAVNEWVDTAMTQNFALLAAQFNVAFAEESVGIQRAGHFPTLDLVGSIGRTETSGAPVQQDGEDALIGLQLTIPLYQGGAVQSRSRQAGFELAQAREQVELQRRATLRQTRDAYNAVIAAIKRVSALAQARISARSALEATEAGLEVGTRTAVEVLTARTDLFRAESDYARARYDYILNTLLLKQAAGSLSVADLEEINRWLEG